MIAMQLVGLANGEPTSLDGEYLKEYDPCRNGVDPDGREMLAHIVTTPDLGEAMTFASWEEFAEILVRVDERDPVRPDGRPNRPLTAFTICTVPIRDTGKGRV